MLSFLPVSPPFDGLCHCMKQLCPEVRLSMDICFNGDSSHTQVHPRAPFTLLQAQLLSPPHNPLASGLWAKHPLLGRSQDHLCIPSLMWELIHSLSSGQRTPQCFWLSHIIPPQRAEAGRQPCSHLLPEPCASTEIPDSKAFLGIQLLPSINITIPLLTGDPCPTSWSPMAPGKCMPWSQPPFTRGTVKCDIGGGAVGRSGA